MFMKVYIITDNIDNGIVASNIVNKTGNTGIISESRSEDPRALLSDLKDNIGSMGELAVLICANPKAVSISANKMSGIRAATCKDAEDAAEATTDAKANVILIDSSKATKTLLSEIIKAWLASTIGEDIEPAEEEAPARAAPSRLLGGIKDAAKSATKAVTNTAKSAKQAVHPRDADDNSDGIVKQIKQKGAAKALKEALGLE